MFLCNASVLDWLQIIFLLFYYPHNKAIPAPEKYWSHSPLMIACEQGEGEIVQVLISKGASVALKNKVLIN